MSLAIISELHYILWIYTRLLKVKDHCDDGSVHCPLCSAHMQLRSVYEVYMLGIFLSSDSSRSCVSQHFTIDRGYLTSIL